MSDSAELALKTDNYQYDDIRQLAVLKRAAEVMAEPTNNLVPAEMRGKVGAIFTAILMARDLGLVGTSGDPLRGLAVALTQIHVIDGKPSLSAQLMRGLILRAGHRIDYVQMDEKACVLIGKRAGPLGGPTLRVVWTIEDAERAELAGKQKKNWNQYPRAMLLARATTELARSLFPDVVLWAGYEPSELGGEPAEDDLTVDEVRELGRP